MLMETNLVVHPPLTDRLLTYQLLQLLKPAVSQLRLVYSARTQG
jgi:hypothetical protein